MSRVGDVLRWLLELPEWLLYLAVGIAAAVENIIPPIPADVMVLAGGVVSGAGEAAPLALFGAVWVGNVGSALLVYACGRVYGPRFLESRVGAYLLAPRQIQALALAYRRYGFPIIFFSRFLPVFRPAVPAFAGVSQVPFWRTALPIALASAIWYGLLVYLGAMAGANWESVADFFSRMGGGLGVIAAVLLAAVGWWWWRTRGPRPGIGSE